MLMLPTDIQFFYDGREWCIYDYPAWIECDCVNSPECLLLSMGG